MSSAVSSAGFSSRNSGRGAMAALSQSSAAFTDTFTRNSTVSSSKTNISLSGVASTSISASNELHQISGTLSAFSYSNSISFASSTSTPRVSTPAMNDVSGGVKFKPVSTSNTLIQNSGTTSKFSQSGPRLFSTSSIRLTAVTKAVDNLPTDLAATSLSSSPSRAISQSSGVTSFNGVASPTTTLSNLSWVSGSNSGNVSVSTNQTSNSELAPSTKLNIASPHSDLTTSEVQTSSSMFRSSASSSARTSVATSTTFATSTYSETSTLTALLQIAIPTTSLSPADAAAIAGGLALGAGLSWLYNKGRSINDVSGLMASKTDFINSIETLKSDMDRFSLDLGGDGSSVSCIGSKSRFLHRKRSIIGDLLGTITKAICTLAELEVDVDVVAPDVGTIAAIAAALVVIDGLASELTKEEEEQEEEEEEEEKESQSAEEQRTGASSIRRTSVSNVPSTSASSILPTSVSSVLPRASCYPGLIQAYPVDIDNPPAAEADVFDAAGAALFAIFGGSGNGGILGSNASISLMNSTLATGYLTTFVPKATTTKAIVSTTDRLTSLASGLSSDVFALASSSVATTKQQRMPVPLDTRIPNGVRPEQINLAALSFRASISSISAASASAASVSAEVASRASASRASASRASASRASASRASASRASASAVSASAASEAAISFPSQISSNDGSSSLCKSIGNSSCITAYSLYNPAYLYTKYTSYVQTAAGFDGEWLGWSCAAMFTCDNNTMYALGMMGQQILNAFRYLYSSDGVGICGSIYMDNGCHLTINACDDCESSMPCDALPDVDQPPHGDLPCYFNNGTTWPPDKAPPVAPDGPNHNIGLE